LLRGVVDAGYNSWLAPAARSAKIDACGRSFALLSTQDSTLGAATLPHTQKKKNSSVLQRSRLNIALSVQ
jgi:hypothetical protein